MLDGIQPIYTHMMNERAEMVPYPVPKNVKSKYPCNITQRCVELHNGKEVRLSTVYDIVIPGREDDDFRVNVVDDRIIVEVFDSDEFSHDADLDITHKIVIQKERHIEYSDSFSIPIATEHKKFNSWEYVSGVLVITLF